MNNGTDKLDMLLRAHGISDDTNESETTSVQQTTNDDTNVNDNEIDDIDLDIEMTPTFDYGDDDADEEIKREDEEREFARQQAIKLRQEEEAKHPKTMTPPDEKDEQYNTEAIGFQSEKLAIVTTMVNKVIAQYHIVSGGVPEQAPDGVTQMMVMGELIDIYHETGEKITPKFVNTLLKHWILPDGRRAIECVSDGIVDDGMAKQGEVDNRPLAKFEPVVININVDGDAPVTVNVDKDLIGEINESNRVDINVVHVSKKDMEERKIVYNSEMKGIIKPYDSNINDVPITLPESGYRCVMKGMTWFDFLKISASPRSGNPADAELRKWSIIYKHMKNVSIGDFADFEDFLKKTKHKDQDLIMWALLAASSKPQEEMIVTCGNPNCKNEIPRRYSPYDLIHIDFEHTPEYYKNAYDAANGTEAIEVWKKINDYHACYRLPTTGIEVEFENPSVWDYIHTKLPIIESIASRYGKKGVDISSLEDDEDAEASIFIIMAVCIKAIYIDDPQTQKTYCFDVWNKIEEIITEALDTDDSGILINLVQQINHDDNGIRFYLDNIQCPKCGRVSIMPIKDIGETMLFHLSRRLANTKINLIRSQSN